MDVDDKHKRPKQEVGKYKKESNKHEIEKKD